MDISRMPNGDLAEAKRLITDVFTKFEAPDYSEEGVRTFFNTALNNDEYMNGLTVYGAFYKKRLAGVLATRKEGTHIALFFVDGALHGQGIGRRLFDEALKYCTSNEMTVNSSPFALNIYRCLGFSETGEEENVNGIRFIPMRYRVE